MSRKNRKKNKSRLSYFILIFIALLYGIFSNEISGTFGFEYEDFLDNINNSNNEIQEVVDIEGDLKIYYIDVGQADSILIECDQEYMLIDGGNNKDGDLLVKYFKSLNITDFKYLVATHPHEDHIGGLDDVIDNFNVGTIYMPDVVTTTQTFYDLLDSIENKNLSFDVPVIGNSFKLGNGVFKVLFTGTDDSDLNNTSIVLKLVYGNVSYLFTGDATDVTEEIIINDDISADVLKVGHHGSRYSTTDKFLERVNPKYAIISVGSENKYGHPANSTINKLNNNKIKTYRTDQDGTIILESDGNNVSFSFEKTNTNGG